MTLLDSGTVGIGTTNPSEKLEVNGDIKTSGNITTGGKITTVGSIGIGNTNPLTSIALPSDGKIGFYDDISNDTTRGIYFKGGNANNVTNNSYAIHRTSGAWTAPNYQQLRISFATGIILDPGSLYGKSYVDIDGSAVVKWKPRYWYL